MVIPGMLFWAATFVTASAAFTRSSKVSEPAESDSVQTRKPTFAILVLLISVYSWVLTLAIHIFDMFFKNGPGSSRYWPWLE